VHGGETRPEGAVVGEQPGRGATVGRPARLVLGRLLAQVGVQWRVVVPGPVGHRRDRRRRDRPHGVDGGTDAHRRGAGGRRRRQPLDTGDPSVGAPVTEATLDLRHRLADPARQVTGVEERETQSGVGCGRHDGLAHGVVAVGPALGIGVPIVELADRRDPRQRHLGEGRGGEGPVRVGIEAAGDGVHALPPCPEAPAVGSLRPAPKGPVEGVGVGVDESRERETPQHDGLAGTGSGRARGHGAQDASGIDVEGHGGDGVGPAEPGQLAPPPSGHGGRTGGHARGHDRGPQCASAAPTNAPPATAATAASISGAR
jgi:hypothetical protein